MRDGMLSGRRKGVLVMGAMAILIMSFLVYRSLIGRNTVAWDEAIKILHDGDVASFFEKHNHDVTLWLKDGKILRTKEPAGESIMDEVKKCGEKRCDIRSFGVE